MTGEGLSVPHDYHQDGPHMAQGIVQWDPTRAAKIKEQFGKEPRFMSVAEQTKAAIWEIRNNSRFSPTKRALEGGDAGNMIDKLVRNYESPSNPGLHVQERIGTFNRLPSLNAKAADDGAKAASAADVNPANPQGWDKRVGADAEHSSLLRKIGGMGDFGRMSDNRGSLDLTLHNFPKGTKSNPIFSRYSAT